MSLHFDVSAHNHINVVLEHNITIFFLLSMSSITVKFVKDMYQLCFKSLPFSFDTILQWSDRRNQPYHFENVDCIHQDHDSLKVLVQCCTR